MPRHNLKVSLSESSEFALTDVCTNVADASQHLLLGNEVIVNIWGGLCFPRPRQLIKTHELAQGSPDPQPSSTLGEEFPSPRSSLGNLLQPRGGRDRQKQDSSLRAPPGNDRTVWGPTTRSQALGAPFWFLMEKQPGNS